MGFMRRFDAGYAAAKKQIEAGRIGMPLVFKATSRDPFRPSLEYANPSSSGGMLIDMGIHDFDLARWFMGDVQIVAAIGATIAYPELETVGDIDNAIASLTFTSGKLGVVDLTRSGIYGYDISTEILGLEGTIRIGYLRETPIMVMTKANGVSHDTVPYFMERFRDAYTNQLQNFAQNVLQGRETPITIDDGMEALRVGVAAHARRAKPVPRGHGGAVHRRRSGPCRPVGQMSIRGGAGSRRISRYGCSAIRLPRAVASRLMVYHDATSRPSTSTRRPVRSCRFDRGPTACTSARVPSGRPCTLARDALPRNDLRRDAPGAFRRHRADVGRPRAMSSAG